MQSLSGCVGVRSARQPVRRQARRLGTRSVERLAFAAPKTALAQRTLAEVRARSSAVEVRDWTAADAVVAFGGDGFLLHVLHVLMRHCGQRSPPVFGVNCGSVGFLVRRLTHRSSVSLCVYVCARAPLRFLLRAALHWISPGTE